VEQLAKHLEEVMQEKAGHCPQAARDLLERAAIEWASVHIRTTKDERLRLGLEISRAIAAYCANDSEEFPGLE